jgi:hypothetical protein
MIILVSVMLAIGVLAALALGSACLIGQALVESQDCPELDAAELPGVQGNSSWQPAAVRVAVH